MSKKLFKKQCIFWDFKKQMGLPAERFKNQSKALQNQIIKNEWDNFLSSKEMFIRWKNFYAHQKKLLEGYDIDMIQLTNDTKLPDHWIDMLQEIITILQNP